MFTKSQTFFVRTFKNAIKMLKNKKKIILKYQIPFSKNVTSILPKFEQLLKNYEIRTLLKKLLTL